METHSSTLAWKIPRIEEPGRLQSMGSLRVGHDWATSLSLFTFMHWRRTWQPTPVLLPGESQGRGAWWAAFCGVAQSQTQLKRLSSSSRGLTIETRKTILDTKISIQSQDGMTRNLQHWIPNYGPQISSDSLWSADTDSGDWACRCRSGGQQRRERSSIGQRAGRSSPVPPPSSLLWARWAPIRRFTKAWIICRTPKDFAKLKQH